MLSTDKVIHFADGGSVVVAGIAKAVAFNTAAKSKT